MGLFNLLYVVADLFFSHWVEIGAALGLLMGSGRMIAKGLKILADITTATWDNVLVDRLIVVLDYLESIARKIGLELTPAANADPNAPVKPGLLARIINAFKKS